MRPARARRAAADGLARLLAAAAAAAARAGGSGGGSRGRNAAWLAGASRGCGGPAPHGPAPLTSSGPLGPRREVAPSPGRPVGPGPSGARSYPLIGGPGKSSADAAATFASRPRDRFSNPAVTTTTTIAIVIETTGGNRVYLSIFEPRECQTP